MACGCRPASDELDSWLWDEIARVARDGVAEQKRSNNHRQAAVDDLDLRVREEWSRALKDLDAGRAAAAAGEERREAQGQPSVRAQALQTRLA